MGQETKADLEPQIASARAVLDAEAARVPKDDDEAHDHEIMMQENQHYLDELQAKYEAAPVEPARVPTDGKLQNAAEKLASGENQSYWEWQTGLGCREAAEDKPETDENAAIIAAFLLSPPPLLPQTGRICFRP